MLGKQSRAKTDLRFSRRADFAFPDCVAGGYFAALAVLAFNGYRHSLTGQPLANGRNSDKYSDQYISVRHWHGLPLLALALLAGRAFGLCGWGGVLSIRFSTASRRSLASCSLY